jgi:hypothetical protein
MIWMLFVMWGTKIWVMHAACYLNWYSMFVYKMTRKGKAFANLGWLWC